MKGEPLTDKAYERLFLEYFRPLTVYAIQFVNQKDIAEDIVQELFLTLYEKKSSLQIGKLTSNYLYKSIRNSCLNNLKYKKIRVIKNPQIQDSLNSKPLDLLEIVELLEFEHKFLQALESLSPKRRRVFELSKVEGKKNDEIAGELKISKSTVETQINRSLKIVRMKLSRHMLHILILFFIEIKHFFIQVN